MKILMSMMVLSLMGVNGTTNSQKVCSGFVEENNLFIPEDVKAGGMSEAEFNQVLDRTQEVYGPIVSAMGKTLVIRRLWSNATVNASAEQQGNNYVLNMYGGLARHPAINKDGFSLVACHELGHHLGGAPKYRQMGWASNEGQADYFANLKCLRIFFTPEETAAFVADLQSRNELDPFLASTCQSSFPNSEEDFHLCIRGSMAGMSVADLFQALRNETRDPRFNTPDSAQVRSTSDSHPGTQCRLDTYFQGSVCTADLTTSVDPRNVNQGTCTEVNGFTSGLRPRCWYKP